MLRSFDETQDNWNKIKLLTWQSDPMHNIQER